QNARAIAHSAAAMEIVERVITPEAKHASTKPIPRDVKDHQLTSVERYQLSALRQQGLCPAEITRSMGGHRSTIIREQLPQGRAATGPAQPLISLDGAVPGRGEMLSSPKQTGGSSMHASRSSGVRIRSRLV